VGWAVAGCSTTVFFPPVTNRLYVDDRRFQTSGVSAVTYILTNHVWPSMTNPGVLARLESARRAGLATSNRAPQIAEQPARRVPVLILMTIMLLLPPIFIMLWGRNQRSRKNN
jgi:hypothetical protein